MRGGYFPALSFAVKFGGRCDVAFPSAEGEEIASTFTTTLKEVTTRLQDLVIKQQS